MSITVRTQAELDKALADKEPAIYIESPAGVWLRVTDTGSSHVVARGSSHVAAWDSARVVASGSAHVVASESSHVAARGSSHVEATDSSHVEAWGSSHVVAWDSSYVVAWGSARVVASGSSYVEARGSARVVASDSAHVVAWDSSYVVASDSAHVVAWDSSYVEATRFVSVHLHSKRVTLTASVAEHVIDVTDINLETLPDFLAYHGVKVTVRGDAVLYKAVDQNLQAGHGYTLTEYPIGGTVTAPDWEATQACGAGLHFGYTPVVARGYFNGEGEPRFLEVHVPLEGLVPLGDKAKAESCLVVREVDLYGRPVAAEEVAS